MNRDQKTTVLLAALSAAVTGAGLTGGLGGSLFGLGATASVFAGLGLFGAAGAAAGGFLLWKDVRGGGLVGAEAPPSPNRD